ncbi:MAG: UDP-glucose/GDP-mannose dehydrogenase family protein, partial [Thermoanaerobaculia bacterium]|nr:UDP-glucose/GDP-mannose dehydrogenase family protein [Thermoanaerobaculia bacterium]
AGEIPIYEPGLDAIVERNREEGRLRFTTAIGEAVRHARALFIAVGTPPGEDGSADLTYVRQVAETIADHVNGPKLVITKSTVPIGTGRMLEEMFDEKGCGHQISVLSNPEFLREGSAIEDFMKPDRVVIGASDEESISLMKEIYGPLHSLQFPFVVTDVESAELIKYASNGFLATKISFINEIANLCESYGADVQSVARGMGLDERIGRAFLQAGPGYGGSCFPKDVAAMVDIAAKSGGSFRILEAVLEVNRRTKRRMVEKIARAVGEDLEGATIGILGLSFKPETDDMRESPAITIIEGLTERGAKIRAYDPEAMDNARPLFPSITFCEDVYEVADGCDAIVIVTEWNEFRAVNFERLQQLMNRSLLIDLRNIYDPARVIGRGFEYVSVGRPDSVERKSVQA